MPEILSIASQKGGVGKTTASVHIAAGLALLKHKTLLIDLDPQRNATSIFSEYLEDDNFGIHSVFKDEVELTNQNFLKTRYDLLKLLPSTMNLSEAIAITSRKKNSFFLLRDALDKYKNFFDYIIIDCPPNLSFLTLNAFVASTGILIPIQASRFVIDGILDLIKIQQSVIKRYNSKLMILGALLNNYNARTTISKAALPLIQQHIHVLKNRITHSIAIEESHLMRQTLYEYNKRHKLATDYKKVVKEVIKLFANRE
ncbi:MAG: ParA family protein [Spirochaetota bacterium]